MNYDLKRIKAYAQRQSWYFNENGWSHPLSASLDEDLSLVKDVEIINPWMDPTGRFELTDEKAELIYGSEAIEEYCERVWEAIGFPIDVCEINLGEGRKLVAEVNSAEKEAAIYAVKDDCVQDLVLVSYEPIRKPINTAVYESSDYTVRVWNDEQNQDYTDKFYISEYCEP